MTSKPISESRLQELYLDPKLGQSSANAFTKKLKAQGYKVTESQVKAAISKTETSQVLSQPKRVNRKDYFPTYGPVDKVSIQADLAFIPKDKSVNKGYAVILTAVNVNTNRAYAIALKSKTVRDKNNKRQEDVEGIVFAMRRLIKRRSKSSNKKSTSTRTGIMHLTKNYLRNLKRNWESRSM